MRDMPLSSLYYLDVYGSYTLNIFLRWAPTKWIFSERKKEEKKFINILLSTKIFIQFIKALLEHRNKPKVDVDKGIPMSIKKIGMHMHLVHAVNSLADRNYK